MPKPSCGGISAVDSWRAHKFVRQESIGPYVCDFVCRERRLVIEVDGGQHAVSTADKVRDAWLRSRRYQVLRFWNNDVLTNIEGVLTVIHDTISR
jgi:very-short-patch-repair endonuclease